MPEERVFTDEELKDFSKDCMDLALGAIETGDLERAKYWCRKEQETKDFLHDGYVHWVTALLSFIHENLGEEVAVRVVREELAKRASSAATHEKVRLIEERGVGAWVEWYVDMVRHHACYPGLTVEEDHEKFIITLNPCGSGGKLVEQRAYEGASGYRKLKRAGTHTWGEQGVPIYCSHCAWAHEILPLQEGGPGAQLWVHATPFPKGPGEPCVHHIYKDPKDIPDKYYTRLGFEKPS